MKWVFLLLFSIGVFGQQLTSSPNVVRDSAIIPCTFNASQNFVTATTLQIISPVVGKKIQICGMAVLAAGATTPKLVQGTGTNCATSQTNLTPTLPVSQNAVFLFGGTIGNLFQTVVSNAVCVTTTSNQSTTFVISYTYL